VSNSYLNANGGTSPNDAVGAQGATILLQDINDMRTNLSSLNLDKTLPVGTSEAGSFFNTQVLGGIDYGMANVHPWFANTTADAAAAWTADFFANTDVAPAKQLSNNPTMYIAETGWPTKSTGTAATDGRPVGAEPTVAHLQTFLDTFICQANTNGTGYFFFDVGAFLSPFFGEEADSYMLAVRG
jgi:exo-beta-1,3-glucanase (GH17 family)